MFELVHSISIDASRGRADGTARIAADHPGLTDHFPDRPILPGTWCVELSAQIAGPLVEEVLDDGRHALLAMIRSATFMAPIELPTAIQIVATIARREPSTTTVQTIVYRGGLLLARAELVFAHIEVTASERATAERDERLERWKAAARSA
jgi:3-hydroxyacyl-[acyl-carrier-protein] dehydratase